MAEVATRDPGAQTCDLANPRRLPVLQGVLPLDPKHLSVDIVAGITLAALAIPEVMGYTSIAGMPVITGLYTIVLPISLFALLGSSRHLVVGADSATAAIMYAGLVGLAAPASPEWVSLAGWLALLTAVYLVLARVLKLGFLADFLSRTVLIGFLTGVGIQVACGQLADMFGVTKTGSGPVAQALNAIKSLPQANTTTVPVSPSVIAVISGGKLLTKKVPWALLAVVGAIAASAYLDLAADGVAVLGTVPSGLPKLAIPTLPQSSAWSALLATALSIFFVILAQSAATSRAYAVKYDDAFDENLDLVGLSLANVAAGVTGTFVVNGSPTKTQMVDSAGGSSQISQLTTAAIVVVVLLFLTKPLSYMPMAVLASVVFIIGVELVDVQGMRSVLSARPVEFWVAAITAAVVVVVGVEQGIVLAIVLSLVAHVRHSYRPHNVLVDYEGDRPTMHRLPTRLRQGPGSSSTTSAPACTTRTRRHSRSRCSTSCSSWNPRWVVRSRMLRHRRHRLHGRGDAAQAHRRAQGARRPVRDVRRGGRGPGGARRLRPAQEIGQDAIFETLPQAIKAFEARGATRARMRHARGLHRRPNEASERSAHPTLLTPRSRPCTCGRCRTGTGRCARCARPPRRAAA